MTTIGLTVNNRRVQAAVEPRSHLADFLREQLNLTGTHLGCEHGVCGACTLLLDGVPARSCITYAVACEGASVTTIEGLEDDAVTAELRTAFKREHALQCGFCTPGMLVCARDLVLRLAEPCEQEIRLGLSGNLCRCTGYVGIVRAVGSVIRERRAQGIAPEPGAGRCGLGPAGSHSIQARSNGGSGHTVADNPPPVADAVHTGLPADDFVPAARFEQRFVVGHPPEVVAALFERPEEIADCLPGAALTGMPAPDIMEGRMRVRMGPISAAFRGRALIERAADGLSGRILGIGDDTQSRSATRGDIRYRLTPAEGGGATQVDVSVGYTLSGAFAQFGRPSLVQDLAGRLTADFARNLEARLRGEAPAHATSADISGAALLLAVMQGRLQALVRWLANRRRR